MNRLHRCRIPDAIHLDGISPPSTAAACGQRCLELAAPLGKSPEYIIEHYKDLIARPSPPAATPLDIEELVRRLIDERARLGCSPAWLRTLGQQLRSFAASFRGCLHHFTAAEFSAWLNRITASQVTRNNYRAAALALVHWARDRRLLEPGWDEFEKIPPAIEPPVEVQIYQPSQIRALLVARQTVESNPRAGSLVPMLALQAFAGLRHSEAIALDWRAIDLDQRLIRLRATIAKTRRLRIIPIHENLRAWLLLYHRSIGPVTDLRKTSSALCRSKRLAGLPCTRGCLSNSLRSSYISYRLAETRDLSKVATEAGNSPGVIQRHYLELATAAQAAAWFAVEPPKADDLPLFEWAERLAV